MSVQSEIERIRGNIADAYSAVEGKGGTAPEVRSSANLSSAIESISTGVDTSDATATAGDILPGKTAYAKGEKVTGNILTQAATTIMPGTAEKTAVAAGRYTTGAVKVAGDANLTPWNIVSGKSIFGVTGQATPNPTSYTGEVHGTVTNGVLCIPMLNAKTHKAIFLRASMNNAMENCFYFMNETDDCFFGNIVEDSGGSAVLGFGVVDYRLETEALYLYIDPMNMGEFAPGNNMVLLFD